MRSLPGPLRVLCALIHVVLALRQGKSVNVCGEAGCSAPGPWKAGVRTGPPLCPKIGLRHRSLQSCDDMDSGLPFSGVSLR